MVATIEALDALKSIGLNLYERKIFVALLAKGIATAAEVSELAKVPRSRSYDVLESLAEKGFVMVQTSKPIKYVALAPKEALDRTKEIMEKKHGETVERIDKLQKSQIIEELDKIFNKGFDL
ncbi:MAG: helix-turn-helix domain-containing protein, partial [Nanoarchaeota archaeon]